MKTLTINQALDIIFTKKKADKLKELVDRLRHLKISHGGNAKINNSENILSLIENS
jgi:hypothetical protein